MSRMTATKRDIEKEHADLLDERLLAVARQILVYRERPCAGG